MSGERFQSFGRATPPAPRAIGADDGIALLKSGRRKPSVAARLWQWPLLWRFLPERSRHASSTCGR